MRLCPGPVCLCVVVWSMVHGRWLSFPRVPGITVATDIICGFPTESESDFTDTLDLVKKYKFPSLFINQFYPRPGTPAARMRRVPTNKVKDRSRELTKLFHSYSPYTDKNGEIQTVLVTELSHDGQYFVGHNKFYDQVSVHMLFTECGCRGYRYSLVQVLVPKEEAFLGKMIQVKIFETGKHFMKGSVLLPSTEVRCLVLMRFDLLTPQLGSHTVAEGLYLSDSLYQALGTRWT